MSGGLVTLLVSFMVDERMRREYEIVLSFMIVVKPS